MKKIILIILMVLLTKALYPGDESRKGTTGADQLLVPVGARSISTGGAFVALVDGLEAVYYNPAGLAINPKTEAMFSYMNYIADINMSYLAVGTSLGDFGSFAFSLKSFDFGDIPITTNEFPDGTGANYSPTFLTVGLTYSKVLTDRVSIGTNIKYISETITNTSATGFAIDAGVQYKFSDVLSIGATLNNVGTNMTYSGQDLRFSTGVPNTTIGAPSGAFEVVTESFQVPSYFQLSLAYSNKFDEENNLLLASSFVANNSLEDAFNFGLEYGYMSTFFIRGGYHLLAQNTDQSIFGFTAGAGINYDMNGMELAFDYAFRDVKEFPTSNHIFTVKLAFQ